MKKIIDGKMYDTEKANEIFCYSKGRRTDFEFVEETLYQTSKGTYFLLCEGGALSQYAECEDANTMSSGWHIELLEEENVKKWLENRADAETYIEVFGEVEEG